MKTIEAEIALMREFKFQQNIVIPNVTVMSGLVGFEADILSLTKAGYATAVEIKVSKADLKNDLKKRHIKNVMGVKPVKGESSSWYYKSMEDYYGNLKHFYYAVPKKLKDDALNQIPSFAGLFVFE